MAQNPFSKREVKKNTFQIPSLDNIIVHLKERKKPASYEELAQELNIIGEKQKKGLHRSLRTMEKDGKLICTKKKYYLPIKKLNFLRGTVIGHRNGFGFLRVEGKKDDYYLSTEQMKRYIHGDIVIAYLQESNRKGQREAHIVKIISPKIRKIVGRLSIKNNSAFVIPNDNRFSFNVFIPLNKINVVYNGYTVVVELIRRSDQQTKIFGKIIEILSNNIDYSMIINIALRTYDIPYVWPSEVQKQIINLQKNVSEADKIGRVDLRNLPLVTIDNNDTNDIDDAIYCEKEHKEGGWRLWVAIADVSYYVHPCTPIDLEAIKRATSVYFPSKAIPMLPETLSNNLCSLNQKVDRLCLVCEMTVSTQGHLSSYKFYEAVINSYARLTYDKVWKFLHGQQELYCNHQKLIEPLTQLYKLYQVLEQARLQRGSISFETEEAKFIFNTKFCIERIEPIKRNKVNKLIEECMILANTSAALFVEKYKKPALYRVHDQPNKEHITSLRILFNKLGLKLINNDKLEPKDYANIMTLISKRSDYEMLQIILMRSMKQAIYNPENRGHFGLALQAYAHFTSPIRRYPDITLHRAIKYILSRKKKYLTEDNTTITRGWHSGLSEMIYLGHECSLKERRADEATRYVTDWLKCDFMKNHIGDIFNGIIINVTNFGFFVRIKKLFIDGLVHMSSLDNDYYNYNNIDGHCLIGEYTGLTYKIGDTVKVYVKSVNMNKRKIYFLLFHSKLKKSLKKPKKV